VGLSLFLKATLACWFAAGGFAVLLLAGAAALPVMIMAD
jgi:hypothetical protein